MSKIRKKMARDGLTLEEITAGHALHDFNDRVEMWDILGDVEWNDLPEYSFCALIINSSRKGMGLVLYKGKYGRQISGNGDGFNIYDLKVRVPSNRKGARYYWLRPRAREFLPLVSFDE